MKTYKLLFLLWMFVSVFTLGVYFGSHPNRQVQLSGDLNAQVEMSRIAMQQSHTLLLVSYLSLGLLAASLVFGLVDHFRTKMMPNQHPQHNALDLT